jgi:mannose-6-phosphate isomerase-like protein (cupin superfamily)
VGNVAGTIFGAQVGVCVMAQDKSFWLPLPVLVLTVLIPGCQYFERAAALDRPVWEFDSGGHDPLPEAPVDAVHSSYEPQTPYERFGEDALIRSVAQTVADGQAIEIRDLLIGPNKETEELRLPGTAVFTVLSGSGTLRMSSGSDAPGRSMELMQGTSGVFALGQSFSISNGSDLPLDIRLRLFATQ